MYWTTGIPCRLKTFFLLFCSMKGKEASAGGGGVWRRCGRGFCHWRWHDGKRSLRLSFFIHSHVENRAHQRANWLQATSQTCHAADTVREFTVLSKSTFLFPRLLFFKCKIVVFFLYSSSKVDWKMLITFHLLFNAMLPWTRQFHPFHIQTCTNESFCHIKCICLWFIIIVNTTILIFYRL